MVWKAPTHCPAGHLLVWPDVKRGWVQCGCPKATGRPTGHDYVLCWPCQREIRENGCDQLVNGRPLPDDQATR